MSSRSSRPTDNPTSSPDGAAPERGIRTPHPNGRTPSPNHRLRLTWGSRLPIRLPRDGRITRTQMAKPNTVLIKMVSSADTGFFYVKKKNPRTKTEKLEMKKYDPVARKHVAFKEQKIK